MLFYRWRLAWDRTWAYRLFQGHHRQINIVYWAHAAALRHSFRATRGSLRSEQADKIFSLKDPDNYNISAIKLGEWGDNYGQFDNWIRLSSLVAITGYLEVYLRTAIRLALESDPGLRHKASKQVDGVRFLKSDPTYSFRDEADTVIIGDWNQRIARYKALFGRAPDVLHNSVKQLEELRRTRNGVTHTFGRATDDYDSLLDITVKPMKQVSERKLLKSMAIADQIAKQVDAHLGNAHIGDYESIYFYHKWDRIYDGRYTEARGLAKSMGERHGRGADIQYFKDLISYYMSV